MGPHLAKQALEPPGPRGDTLGPESATPTLSSLLDTVNLLSPLLAQVPSP